MTRDARDIYNEILAANPPDPESESESDESLFSDPDDTTSTETINEDADTNLADELGIDINEMSGSEFSRLVEQTRGDSEVDEQLLDPAQLDFRKAKEAAEDAMWADERRAFYREQEDAKTERARLRALAETEVEAEADPDSQLAEGVLELESSDFETLVRAAASGDEGTIARLARRTGVPLKGLITR